MTPRLDSTGRCQLQELVDFCQDRYSRHTYLQVRCNDQISHAAGGQAQPSLAVIISGVLMLRLATGQS